MTRMRRLQEGCHLLGDVRGKGLMIGLELVKDKEKTPASAEAGHVRRLCREAGVLVGVGGSLANVVRIQPPLILTEDEADRVCTTLEKVCREVDGHR